MRRESQKPAPSLAGLSSVNVADEIGISELEGELCRGLEGCSFPELSRGEFEGDCEERTSSLDPGVRKSALFVYI